MKHVWYECSTHITWCTEVVRKLLSSVFWGKVLIFGVFGLCRPLRWPLRHAFIIWQEVGVFVKWCTGVPTFMTPQECSHWDKKPSLPTFFKPEYPHGIQSIDKCQTQAKPFAVGLGKGPELIMAPRKIFITLPCMSERLLHCLPPASCWNITHTRCLSIAFKVSEWFINKWWKFVAYLIYRTKFRIKT